MNVRPCFCPSAGGITPRKLLFATLLKKHLRSVSNLTRLVVINECVNITTLTGILTWVNRKVSQESHRSNCCCLDPYIIKGVVYPGQVNEYSSNK